MHTESLMKDHAPIHAYRLEYPDSPHAPEKLWEWEKEHVARLLWNATTFGRELAQADRNRSLSPSNLVE